MEVGKRTQRDHDHRGACGVYPEREISLELEASKDTRRRYIVRASIFRRGYLRHDYENVSKNSLSKSLLRMENTYPLPADTWPRLFKDDVSIQSFPSKVQDAPCAAAAAVLVFLESVEGIGECLLIKPHSICALYVTLIEFSCRQCARESMKTSPPR